MQYDGNEGDDSGEEKGGATAYNISDATKGEAGEAATDPNGRGREASRDGVEVEVLGIGGEDVETVTVVRGWCKCPPLCSGIY